MWESFRAVGSDSVHITRFRAAKLSSVADAPMRLAGRKPSLPT